MQFFKYIISGLLNTGFGLFLIYFLYKIIKLDILLANTIAYLIGFLLNFCLMSKFVFHSHEKLKKKFFLLMASFILSLSLSILLLSILIKIFPKHTYALQVLTMIVYSIGMYFLSKQIFVNSK
jgi:putative flippase GtrA